MTISSIYNRFDEVENYVALFTDITTIKEHQVQLEYIAHFDELTKLPNRKHLVDSLAQSMLRCQHLNQSLAVAYIDLDGFKSKNDTYGHTVGDELLIEVSSRMRQVLRQEDTLARIGGDEFVAVITGFKDQVDCEKTLERLLGAASEPVRVENALLQTSASIGAALYPQDNVNADKLLRHADQAMYTAKRLGRNRYQLFNDAQHSERDSRMKDIKRIEQGLKNNEFVLHYQPKVNMRTGAVIGVEALIRWQHPERGMLYPNAFLPLIDNHMFSIDLGEWVIDTALGQIAQWKVLGVNIPVSVNIDAIQLQSENFAKRLTSLLSSHSSVNAQSLQLEILETSALSDLKHVAKLMESCEVSFSLDDFGTGYSSLTYLRHLPTNQIKIDKSFVQDMLVNVNDSIMVESIIGLANSFKREVIAEGVETSAHGAALLQLGCELAQGYAIARPMPAKEMPHWIETWTPEAIWQINNNAYSNLS
ncbi:putative bifunctional diguanylate cyclase/phosphodiesterase [Vibrio algarum]|uniref:EAL domain-containing protein n=1 Tax=Vibrio algarum TaxID=3020714 RepID=A0ABT4YMC5_9VIBR|nr:EAL domain-containing protein [Vibrio sp. KJ40-1]MDB1122696.1 EAL domain-containing protein [Vibrio sp. KJ40-1]